MYTSSLLRSYRKLLDILYRYNLYIESYNIYIIVHIAKMH